jgi:hypothetical protein
MNAPTLGAFAATLKSDVTEWVKTKLELLRLETLDKTATAATLLLYGLILLNIVFFALLFAFLTLGVLLGQWVGSLAGGFALISLLYLLLLGLLILGRKTLWNKLKDLFLIVLEPDLKDETTYETRHAPRTCNGQDPDECV